MEGLPGMPLLWIPLRTAEDEANFSTAIGKVIREKYETDPADYTNEITEMNNCRRLAVAYAKVDSATLKSMQRYILQAARLRGRFGNEIGMKFVWADAFSTNCSSSEETRFDEANVLWNVAALYSLFGAKEVRSADDSLKKAVANLQLAAGTFENVAQKYADFAKQSAEFDTELLQLFSTLMLAQAHEVIFEKSLRDARRPASCALLAANITAQYRSLAQRFDTEKPRPTSNGSVSLAAVFSSALAKTWRRLFELKRDFYEAIQFVESGLHAESNSQFGDAVAYFELSKVTAEQCVDAVAKLSNAADSNFTEPVRFLLDVTTAKFDAAKRDNELVYHDRVPTAAAVRDRQVRYTALARCTTVNWEDPELIQPDPFARLVPADVIANASIYSNRLADLLRRMVAEADSASEQLTADLRSRTIDPEKLRLDVLLSDAFENECVSQPPETSTGQQMESERVLTEEPAIGELFELATRLRSNEVEMSVTQLCATMSDLASCVVDVQDLLETLRTTIESELKDDSASTGSDNHADRQTITTCKNELSELESTLAIANRTNEDLQMRVRVDVDAIRLLRQFGSRAALNASLPNPFHRVAPLLRAADGGSNVRTQLEELARMLAKLEEMKTQRAALIDRLRSEILADSVVGALLERAHEQVEAVFADQMRKHDGTIALLRANLAAQPNIVRALDEAVTRCAQFVAAFYSAVDERRERIRSLTQSGSKLAVLISKVHEGVTFFKQCERTLQNIQQRLADPLARARQRRHLAAKRRIEPPKPQPPPQPTPNIGGRMTLEEARLMLEAASASAVTESGRPPVTPLPANPYAAAAADSAHHGAFPNGNQGGPANPTPEELAQAFAGGVMALGSGSGGKMTLKDVMEARRAAAKGSSAGQVGKEHAAPSAQPITLAGQPQSVPAQAQFQAQPQAASTQSQFPGQLHAPASQPPQQYPAPLSGSTAAYYNGQPTPIAQPQSDVTASLSGHQPYASGSAPSQYAQPSMPTRTEPTQVNATFAYTSHSAQPQFPNKPPVSATQSQFAPQPTSHPASNPSQFAAQPQSVPSQPHPQPTSTQTQFAGQPLPASAPAPFNAQSQSVSAHAQFATQSHATPAQQQFPGTLPTPAQVQFPTHPHPTSTQAQFAGQPQSVPGQAQFSGQLQPVPMQAQFQAQPQSQAHFTGQPQSMPAQSSFAGQSQQSAAQTQFAPQAQPMSTQVYIPGHPQPTYAQAQFPAQLQSTSQIPFGGQPQLTSSQTQLPGQPQPAAVSAQAQFQAQSQAASAQAQYPGQSTNHQKPQTTSSQAQFTAQPQPAPTQTQFPGQPQLNAAQTQFPGYQQSATQVQYAAQAQLAGRPEQAMQFHRSVQQQPLSATQNHLALQPNQAQSAVQPSTTSQPQHTSSTTQSHTAPYFMTPAAHASSGMPSSSPYTNTYAQPSAALLQQQATNLARASVPAAATSGAVYQQPQQQLAQAPMTTSGLQQWLPTGAQQTAQAVPSATSAYQSQPTQASYVQPTPPTSTYQHPNVTAAASVSAPYWQPTQASAATRSQPKVDIDTLLNADLETLAAPLCPIPLAPLSSDHALSQSVASVTQTNAYSQPPMQVVETVPSQPIPLQSSSLESVNLSPVHTHQQTAQLDILSGSPRISPLAEASIMHRNETVPDARVGAESDIVELKPHLVTADDLVLSKKEEQLKTVLRSSSVTEWLSDNLRVNRLVCELEKFARLVQVRFAVDNLLVAIWNELADAETNWLRAESASGSSRAALSTIGKCYPLKNRDNLLLPFDANRVPLRDARDDYINASYVDSIGETCAPTVVTQWPLQSTMAEFWLLIFELGCEVIVCLANGKREQLAPQTYWPTTKGEPLRAGSIEVTLQVAKENEVGWTERIFTLRNIKTAALRSVVHLECALFDSQLPTAQVPGFAAAGVHEPFVRFVAEVHSFYAQQRSLVRPIVVHCTTGCGRTGLFLLTYAAMRHVQVNGSLPDLPATLRRLRTQRRGLVETKEQLAFAYETVLHFTTQLLERRGIQVNLPRSPARMGRDPHSAIAVTGNNEQVQKSPASAAPNSPTVNSRSHSRNSSLTSLQKRTGGSQQLPASTPFDTLDLLFSDKPVSVLDLKSVVVDKMTTRVASESLSQLSTQVESNGAPLNPTNGEGKSNLNGSDTEVQHTNGTNLNADTNGNGTFNPKVDASCATPNTYASGPTRGAQLVLPDSLKDLVDPTKFELTAIPPEKRRITKLAFTNPELNRSTNLNDPFALLDPLVFAAPSQAAAGTPSTKQSAEK